MSDPSAGRVSLDVVPNFAAFGSLFSQGVRGALTGVQTLGKEAGKVLGGGVQGGIALGIAGAAIVIGDFVASGVREFQRLGNQTRELQRITGASAKEASTFAAVIEEMGGVVASVTRGLGIFGAHMSAQPELFQRYGVAIAYTNSGQLNLLGTLDNLRKKFQQDTDVVHRNQVAKELLGKSYQALLPYLNLSNERFAAFQRLARESGRVLDDRDVETARNLAVEMRYATDRLEGLKVAAGRAGAGFLKDFFTGFDIISHETTVFGKLRDLVGGLFGRDFSSAGARQAASDLQAAGTAAAAAGIAYENFAKAEDSIQQAAAGARTADLGVASAQENVQRAHEGVLRAERGVASAHHATAEAAHGLAEAERNVHEAEQGVLAAHRQVRDATEALGDAQERLNELQKGATADELTNAHLDLAGATLALAEARFQAGRTRPTAEDPFAARRARLNVAQATERQREAQEGLTAAQQKGTSADKNVTEAQRAVRDASERLTDALGGEEEAQHRIAEAKHGVAEAAYAVQQAQVGESEAALGVRDAHLEVTVAEEGLQTATYEAATAHEKLQQALDAARASGVSLAGVVDDLIAKYPQLRAELEDLVKPVPIHFQAPGAAVPIDATYDPRTGQLHLAPGPTGVGAGVPVPRQHGGQTWPGAAFLVGEHGPEILYNGRVYPSGQTPPAIQGSDGASLDPNVFAAAVASAVDGLVVVLDDGTTMGRVAKRSSRRYQRAFSGRR